MFTLRKITGDGIELNFYLGKSYTLVTKENNSNEFEETRKHLKYEPHEVYGFVSGEDGNVLGLFPNQQNYVMVGGKTIDNLTL